MVVWRWRWHADAATGRKGCPATAEMALLWPPYTRCLLPGPAPAAPTRVAKDAATLAAELPYRGVEITLPAARPPRKGLKAPCGPSMSPCPPPSPPAASAESPASPAKYPAESTTTAWRPAAYTSSKREEDEERFRRL